MHCGSRSFCLVAEERVRGGSPLDSAMSASESPPSPAEPEVSLWQSPATPVEQPSPDFCFSLNEFGVVFAVLRCQTNRSGLDQCWASGLRYRSVFFFPFFRGCGYHTLGAEDLCPCSHLTWDNRQRNAQRMLNSHNIWLFFSGCTFFQCSYKNLMYHFPLNLSDFFFCFVSPAFVRHSFSICLRMMFYPLVPFAIFHRLVIFMLGFPPALCWPAFQQLACVSVLFTLLCLFAWHWLQRSITGQSSYGQFRFS